MSLIEPVLAEAATPDDFARQAAERVTPYAEYAGAKLMGGLEALRPVEALGLASLPSRYTTDEYGLPPPGPPPADLLSKEQFDSSIYKRPGLEWEDGETEARAAARAAVHDRQAYRDSLVARSDAGWLGQTAGFALGLGTAALDPTNYIPLIGPASKAAMVARFGRIGGALLGHGADAALNTGLFEPLAATTAQAEGRSYGWEEAGSDILTNALGGALLGTAAGEAARALGVGHGLPKTPEVLGKSEAPISENKGLISETPAASGIAGLAEAEPLPTITEPIAPPIVGVPTAGAGISLDDMARRRGALEGQIMGGMAPAPWGPFDVMPYDELRQVVERDGAALADVQAHGIAGANPEHQLDALLTGGIDKGRAFHTGPLGQSGDPTVRAAGLGAKVDAPYVLLGAPGERMKEGGIRAVVVNGAAKANLDDLKARYPGVTFLAPDEVAGWAKGADGVAAPPEAGAGVVPRRAGQPPEPLRTVAPEAAPDVEGPGSGRPPALHSMTLDEARGAIAGLHAEDMRTVTHILGSEDAAREYLRQERIMMTGSEAGAEAARAKIERLVGDKADELDEAMNAPGRHTLEDLQEIENAREEEANFRLHDDEFLARSLSKSMEGTTPAAIASALRGEAQPARVHAAIVRMTSAMAELRRRGLSAEEIGQHIVSSSIRAGASREQAAELLAEFMRPKQRPAEQPVPLAIAPPRRAARPPLRVDDLMRRADAAGLALDQIDRGEPVDVGKLLANDPAVRPVEPRYPPPSPEELARRREVMEALYRDGIVTREEVALPEPEAPPVYEPEPARAPVPELPDAEARQLLAEEQVLAGGRNRGGRMGEATKARLDEIMRLLPADGEQRTRLSDEHLMGVAASRSATIKGQRRGRIQGARGAVPGDVGGGGLPPGIDAYHGSAREFDRFTLGFAGTGEGGASHGPGIYLAEAPEVADHYGERLAARSRDAAGKGKQVYKVRIATTHDRLLQWDKPIDEQSPTVREAAEALYREMAPDSKFGPGDLTGRQFHYILTREGRLTPAEAARRLDKAGVHGIRYLDAGARGEGTHDILVFDPSRIHIAERNGRPMSLAKAAPEPVPPTLAEAAPRVGKAVAELAALKQDAGLAAYEKPLPGHEPKLETATPETTKAGKAERPPTAQEKAAAMSALPPELQEIEHLRREGVLRPEDEAALAAAEATAQKAEGYAAGWQALASCVLRNLT